MWGGLVKFADLNNDEDFKKRVNKVITSILFIMQSKEFQYIYVCYIDNENVKKYFTDGKNGVIVTGYLQDLNGVYDLDFKWNVVLKDFVVKSEFA